MMVEAWIWIWGAISPAKSVKMKEVASCDEMLGVCSLVDQTYLGT